MKLRAAWKGSWIRVAFYLRLPKRQGYSSSRPPALTFHLLRLLLPAAAAAAAAVEREEAHSEPRHS